MKSISITLGILFCWYATCFGGGVVRNSVVKLVRDQRDECLYAFNAVRKNHGLPLLTWDDSLSRGAQEWAISIAARVVLENDGFRKYGEVITYLKSDQAATCAQVALYFYSNGLKDYPTNPHISKIHILLFMATSHVSSFALGITWAGGNSYIVLRTRQTLPTQRNVPRYYKVLVISNFIMPNAPAKQILTITITHNTQTWTTWISRKKCTFTCGITEYIPQEKFCLRFNKNQDCSGERERTAICDDTKKCLNSKKKTKCIDLDPAKCQSYRELQSYCRTPIYAVWMRKNCKKSCGFCSTGPRVTTAVKKKTQFSCVDVDPVKCQSYNSHLKTYCVTPIHAVWMRKNCKKSCGFCSTGPRVTTAVKKKTQFSCVDVDPVKCQSYNSHLKTYCVTPIYAVWMKQNCRRSCGYCAEQACQDSHPKCMVFAQQNYCTNQVFSDWMTLHCPTSCRITLSSCSRVGKK